MKNSFNQGNTVLVVAIKLRTFLRVAIYCRLLELSDQQVNKQLMVFEIIEAS